MTHPEELLAPYVDGTASPREREVVDAHAATCARCRAEIAQASTARTALKALHEMEAPPGLAPDVTGAPKAAPAGAPIWYRWGGVAAAAAAIVLLMVLVLPRIGGGGSSDAERATPAAANAPRAATVPVPLEIQQVDYGHEALSSLAFAADATLRLTPPPPAPTEVTAGSSDGAVALKGTPAQARRAEACLQTAFVTVPGSLVRLISATFNGKPAYIGLYEESPGAGQPADAVAARAASARTCTPLSLAESRLPG